MVVNVTKISQRMKNKGMLSIEKNIIEWKKTLYYNYKKVFSFGKFYFFIRKSISNFFLLRLCLKRNARNFWFSCFSNSLLKCKNFYKLVAKKFHLLKYKKLFRSGFLLPFELRKLLHEILVSSVSRNIKNFSGVSVFRNTVMIQLNAHHLLSAPSNKRPGNFLKV